MPIAGLPARPFWNSALLGPRFLASAFTAGPAFMLLLLGFVRVETRYHIEDAAFHKLALITTVAAQINLIMLASELFYKFYFPTHHSINARYLFFAEREARKKQHHVQLKEVKMRPGIEDHDFEFKTRHARRFLEEGNKVKLTMMFKGRQVTHPEIGLEVLSRAMSDLEEMGKVESQPSFEGRVMSMVVAPLKAK